MFRKERTYIFLSLLGLIAVMSYLVYSLPNSFFSLPASADELSSVNLPLANDTEMGVDLGATAQAVLEFVQATNTAVSHLPGGDCVLGPGANLTHCNLMGRNLNSVDLSDANLKGANLNGANLSGATLLRADLTAAQMESVDLTGANLTAAILVGTDLTDAILVEANLQGAILAGAVLHGADLRAADLTNADLIAADFSAANLLDAIVNILQLSETYSIDGAILPF